ncbi:MAG TPA: aldo/keto reductase [Bryobacteraceae bacterium]|nr:aldo/keto reductase [Bryobacteraceae bacterium]
MQYTRFGSTGLKVSRLCLGTMTYGSREWRPWVLPNEEARPFIRRAVELGINFFDSADMYSVGASEEVLGGALRDFGPPRDRSIIATKVYNPMSDDPNDRGLSRKHIFNSIDASLRRLRTDYVDLYQIHRFDYETPIEETLVALNDLVRAGKVRYIGASAMYGWQFMKMLTTSDRLGIARFASMQDYYNLVYREEEREMLPLCRAEGIAVIPFSPLARGFVAGNRTKEDYGETVRAKTDEFSRRQYYSEQDFAIVDRITQVAKARGVNNAQIALAWVLQQPGITAPIVGASKPGQLEDAVAALDIKLDPEELKLLTELYRPRAIMGHG